MVDVHTIAKINLKWLILQVEIYKDSSVKQTNLKWYNQIKSSMYTLLQIERAETINIRNWQDGGWTKISNITSEQLQVQGPSVRAKKAGIAEQVLNNAKERRVEQTILRDWDELSKNNEIVQ